MPTDTQTQNGAKLAEDRQTWRQRLGAWGLANALAQKFQVENAAIAKNLGVPMQMVPFGNFISTNTQPAARGLLPSAITAGVTLLGLGAGGLGLAQLTGLLNKAPTPAVVAPLLNPESLPLSIDWELTPNAGTGNTTDAAGSTDGSN